MRRNVIMTEKIMRIATRDRVHEHLDERDVLGVEQQETIRLRRRRRRAARMRRVNDCSSS